MRLRTLALALCMVLVSCQSGSDDPTLPLSTPRESPTGTDTLIIGVVGTTSGPRSWRGDNAFRGADLGVNILNRTREQGDRVIELRTLDDGGDPNRAISLVEELAGSDRTIGVVYAGPPDALPEAEQALARAGIPAFLTFGDLYSARKLTPHVFQVSPPYLWQARVIARYLVRDRRYATIGLLATDTPSGRVARYALRAALLGLGRRPPVASMLGRDDPGYGRALRKLKRRGAEAVVLEAPPPVGAGVLGHLKEQGWAYRTTARARISSAATRRKARKHQRDWRPQVVGFDPLVTALPERLARPGLVASETYARGAHYLPIPSLESFQRAYLGWWESEPLAWEHRAFEAVRMIGWAVRRAVEDEDLALVMEEMTGERFGGLDVTFGPDDHTSVNPDDVGLWVVPKPGAAPEARSLPENLPWVLLGRGFSIDRERTDIASGDWRYLWPGAPPPNGPAPRISRAEFGVTSPRSDPVH